MVGFWDGGTHGNGSRCPLALSEGKSGVWLGSGTEARTRMDSTLSPALNEQGATYVCSASCIHFHDQIFRSCHCYLSIWLLLCRCTPCFHAGPSGASHSIEVPCIEAPGHVKCFFTPSDPGNPHRGILVTGAGAGGGPGPGGSFGPYEHYNTLAQTLPAEGIAVLQIVWRKFADLEAATQDMMACMRYPPSGPLVSPGGIMLCCAALCSEHHK